MPRALWLYVPIYDHFLGPAAERRGGERRVPLWLYHSINKGRTHGRSSTFIIQPAAGPVEKTIHIALSSHLLVLPQMCVCVCVCVGDGVRSLCS